MIEIVVSMFIMSVGLLSLVPLQIGAASRIGLANERQQATALANKAVEQIRDAAEDPARAAAIIAGGPAYSSEPAWSPPNGESLRTTTTPDSALAESTTSRGGARFTVRTYVTARSGDPANTLWLTALAYWTSGNTTSAGDRVIVRSILYLGA